MPRRTYVIGGNVRESQHYCNINLLHYPDAVILDNRKGVLTTSRVNVHLVGSFYERDDAATILKALDARSAVVEDMT